MGQRREPTAGSLLSRWQREVPAECSGSGWFPDAKRRSSVSGVVGPGSVNGPCRAGMAVPVCGAPGGYEAAR